MSASPAPRSSGSLASSTSGRSYKASHKAPSFPPEESVPVETLVEHLLAAKRSLSSISLVLRANEITQDARRAHEVAVILNAQSEFLRRAVIDQVRLLLRVRKGLARSYDCAKKDFGRTIQMMDAANNKLNRTIGMLRATVVDSAFRPRGEDPRNLMDFVDEKSVHSLRESLKYSIGELQVRKTRSAAFTAHFLTHRRPYEGDSASFRQRPFTIRDGYSVSEQDPFPPADITVRLGIRPSANPISPRIID